MLPRPAWLATTALAFPVLAPTLLSTGVASAAAATVTPGDQQIRDVAACVLAPQSTPGNRSQGEVALSTFGWVGAVVAAMLALTDLLACSKMRRIGGRSERRRRH